ncbi:MAG: hypothetical protein KF816_03635 [Melioribacteraceae bacterium]|nr:hypothetical protein [Melioribacteraceae bacterium]
MNSENDFRNNDYERLKCIWMASQVIEYKLCDHQFDCENCPFDQVMRNYLNKKEPVELSTTNVVNIISERLQKIKYDDKITYLDNNFIAKEICQNTYYLGINPILHYYLDAVSSTTIQECGKNISIGQHLIQFSGRWGSINLYAPMNLIIYDKLGDPSDHNSKSQWFAIIGDINKEISDCRITQEEWNSKYQKAIEIIEETKSQLPKVGSTMFDGGTQLNYLYQIVGTERYLEILHSLCSE